MRVFTVGIGDGASAETCDGIARAGRGSATYILTAEASFLSRCVRLVLAARTPPITNFKIFGEKENPNTSLTQGRLGNAQRRQRMRIGTRTNDGYEYVPPSDVGPLLRACQAPAEVTFLNGTRMSVFAIVPLSILTEESALRVDFDIGGQEYRLSIVPIVDFPHSRGTTR
jgi:hypothetical protein